MLRSTATVTARRVLIIQHYMLQRSITLHNPRQRLFSSSSSTTNKLKQSRSILGLLPSETITPKKLRQAYRDAAMKSHPDIMQQQQQQSSKDDGLAFRKVTDAYEFLLQYDETIMHHDDDDNLGITAADEENYRVSCQDWLGVPAHVVEESKQCPMFRKWLQGKTDAAYQWRLFFAMHGGMAPMLKTPAVALLGDKSSSTTETGIRSRRRRRR